MALVFHAAALALSVSGKVPVQPLSLVPATVYVRTGGSDSCNGTVDADYTPGAVLCAKKTIQAGLGAVQSGGTVHIAAGTYRENVLVNKKVTLWGAGAGTVVQPAVSSPNPCANSSLCGGAASNVFLIRSSDVTVRALTVDGDNPTLTGLNVGGANIDARNGIIEDHLTGVYNRLTVRDVTVKNVFLRGINAGSGGDDFSFHDNHVTNVRGSQFSVGIFAFDARGTIQSNNVTLANDAISVNHSRGVKILANTVTQSGSGIHIDNSKPPAPGISSDRIQDNSVSNCTVGAYGVWIFVPGADALVDANTVTSCGVGLALVGGGAASDITFSNNTVTGDATGASGILVSTDSGGYGDFDTEAVLTGNYVTGFDAGATVEQGGGKTANAYFDQNRFDDNLTAIDNRAHSIVYGTCFHQNQRGVLNQLGASAEVHTSSFVGNDVAGVENIDAAAVDATNNWWDSAAGPDEGQPAVGPVSYDPFLFSDPNDCN